MEPAIKYINKKFPSIDFRGNIVTMTTTFEQALFIYFLLSRSVLLWSSNYQFRMLTQKGLFCLIHWKHYDKKMFSLFCSCKKNLLWQLCWKRNDIYFVVVTEEYLLMSKKQMCYGEIVKLLLFEDKPWYLHIIFIYLLHLTSKSINFTH